MEVNSIIERRRTVRRAFRGPAKILLPRLPVIPVQTIEISLGGIGIVSDGPIPANSACAVAFEIQAQQERRRVNIWGTVAHTCALREDMYRSGIALVDTDAASRQFLHQFIEELAAFE